MSIVEVEILADSINPWGDRFTTFRLRYPRIILAELNTHRMLSKNSSSSRAIPVEKAIDYIVQNPFIPEYWGKNKPGMSASEQENAPVLVDVAGRTVAMTNKDAWLEGMKYMTNLARSFSQAGYHKQLVNRLTETWSYMNTIVSGTDFDNFFWLRCDGAAQPEIQKLAYKMKEAREHSTPEELRHNEWHTPYIDHDRDKKGNLIYLLDGKEISRDRAIATSCAAVAQVSYRKNDTSDEKVKKVFDMLMNGDKLHGSAFEHTATPFSEDEYMIRQRAFDMLKSNNVLDNANQCMYSGNLRGWQQFRKMLPNENHVKIDNE